MEPPGLKNHTLMLADTESEKTKWVVALSELHRILKRNNLPNRTVSALRFFFFFLAACKYLDKWQRRQK
jgi:serine/threonine-protein kinase MRCK